MANATITITEEQKNILHTLAEQTGKSEEELVQEAVELLVRQFRQTRRQELIQQAFGMWRDRMDLPDLAELRRESSARLYRFGIVPPEEQEDDDPSTLAAS